MNRIKELKDKTGCSISNCKEALKNCDDNILIAEKYLQLKTTAVSRKKIIDGKLIPWETDDYVKEAKNILSC